MFGVILFWVHYIIAAVLLYHNLRCIYVKSECNNTKYGYKLYKITESDKRLKLPLWSIILFFIAFFIPVFNLIVFTAYLCGRLINESGSEYNKYYCKSIFTKKY